MRLLYAHQGCFLALPDTGYDQTEVPYVRTGLLWEEAVFLKREIQEAARLGCDGFVQLFSGLDDLVTYSWLGHPEAARRETRVEAIAEIQRDLAGTAHALGLKYYLQNYDLMVDPWVKGRLSDETIEDILRNRFREIFERSGCDGLVVTPTEAYDRGASTWVSFFSGTEGIAKMAGLYHRLIVEEMGRELRFRLWLLAENAEQWTRLGEILPRKTIYTVKCNAGDFWMDTPPNPALKKRPDGLKLGVIFDAFHQYHGWGHLLALDPSWPDAVTACREQDVTELHLWGSWAPSCIWPNRLPGYLDGEKAEWQGAYLENGIWKSDALMARLNLRYVIGLSRGLAEPEALDDACRGEGIDGKLLAEAREVFTDWWAEFYFSADGIRYEYLNGWATVFQSPAKTWRLALQRHGAMPVQASAQRMREATRRLRLLRPPAAHPSLARLWDRTLLFFETYTTLREAVVCDPALPGWPCQKTAQQIAGRLKDIVRQWEAEFPAEARLWQITADYPAQPRPCFLRRGSVADYAEALPFRTPSDIPEGNPWTFSAWQWEDEHERE